MHTPQATRRLHRAIDHRAFAAQPPFLSRACRRHASRVDDLERIDHRRSERSFSGLERQHCGGVPLLVRVTGVREWLRT
jgi:hypothetical protein